MGLDLIILFFIRLALMLRARLNDSLKEAMKAKEARRVSTLRMVMAALKDRDIAARTEDSREDVPDDEVLQMLSKMVKQRRDSIAAFEQGGRPDLAAVEAEEIAIIEEFLPRQMAEAEVQAAAAAIIAELGAAGPKDMGRVMAALKERHAGQMDFGRASGVVKSLLS
jgi:uncharacterized protein